VANATFLFGAQSSLLLSAIRTPFGAVFGTTLTTTRACFLVNHGEWVGELRDKRTAYCKIAAGQGLASTVSINPPVYPVKLSPVADSVWPYCLRSQHTWADSPMMIV